MYIKGKVIAIEDNLIRIRNVKYPKVVITANRDNKWRMLYYNIYLWINLN